MRKPRLPRVRRYPIWNVTSVLLVGLIVLAATGSSVFLANNQPLLIELELTLAVVAACLFAFLTAGLYWGVRFRKEQFSVPSAPDPIGDWGWQMPDFSGADLGDAGGDEFGCLGVALGLIAGAILLLLVIGLLYLLIPVAYLLVILVAFTVWWLAYLALRRVFVLSKWCQGSLVRSVTYAAAYTLLYTGWLFAILAAAQWWLRP